jgi:hypothetical protein
MTTMPSPPIQATDDLRGADAAMARLAVEVRRAASLAGTPIATWRDGRVVLEPVPPVIMPASLVSSSIPTTSTP